MTLLISVKLLPYCLAVISNEIWTIGPIWRGDWMGEGVVDSLYVFKGEMIKTRLAWHRYYLKLIFLFTFSCAAGSPSIGLDDKAVRDIVKSYFGEYWYKKCKSKNLCII